MTPILRLIACSAVCLSFQVPALAQPTQQAQQVSADDVALARKAVERLSADDADGAVELLEPIRDRDDAPPQLEALLGASYLEAGRPEDALAILGPLADDDDADPAVLYNAGRAALAAGESERGEEYLRRSVALQPGTPAARELGLRRGQQGHLRAAYRLLRPWTLAHPEDKEARMAAALAAVRLERTDEARELLDGLPADEPQARLLRSQLRLEEKDPRGALTILSPVLESPPESSSEGMDAGMEMDVRKTLAQAHLEIDQPKQAVELLDGRTEGDPAATLLLAKAEGKAGDTDAAIALLEPLASRLLAVAVQTDGKIGNQTLGTDFALEYGRLLLDAGRQEEALPYFEMVTRVKPETSEAWQLLADTFEATDQPDKAAVTRQRAAAAAKTTADLADREGQDPTARQMQHAQALAAEGKLDEALKIARAERGFAPEDIRPLLMESRVLLLDGRKDEALEVADQAVQDYPDHPDAYYQRGTVLLGMQQLDRAEQDLRHVLELAPEHVPAMNDLAVLLIVRDRRDEARTLLQKVLEIKPDDPQAKQTLEQLQSGG